MGRCKLPEGQKRIQVRYYLTPDEKIKMDELFNKIINKRGK